MGIVIHAETGPEEISAGLNSDCMTASTTGLFKRSFVVFTTVAWTGLPVLSTFTLTSTFPRSPGVRSCGASRRTIWGPFWTGRNAGDGTGD